MNDYLIYRFPGKELISKNGKFVNKEISENLDGFFVSNYDHSKLFHFLENNSNTNFDDFKFHFSKLSPLCMSPHEYYIQAHELLNDINLLQMDKVVFSRIKQISFQSNLIKSFFFRLLSEYPNAFVYLISSESFGTWIGASPEIILEAHKNFIFTTSLAGTKKVNDDSEWGEKEIVEQQVVTDYVVQVLEKEKLQNIEQIGPYDFEAGPVKHLKTDISAERTNQNPLDLAFHLHPTPAVCGSPKDKALNLIQKVELHDRSLYTGMIGVNTKESCKIYVNLRCAQIQENNIFLYLGGGFTPQSIPESEWIETENKSKTLINCME